jgi:hypothetical protein
MNLPPVMRIVVLLPPSLKVVEILVFGRRGMVWFIVCLEVLAEFGWQDRWR